MKPGYILQVIEPGHALEGKYITTTQVVFRENVFPLRDSGLRSTVVETHCIQLGFAVSNPTPRPATQTIAAPTRSTSPRLLLTSTKGSTEIAISAAEAKPTRRA